MGIPSPNAKSGGRGIRGLGMSFKSKQSKMSVHEVDKNEEKYWASPNTKLGPGKKVKNQNRQSSARPQRAGMNKSLSKAVFMN